MSIASLITRFESPVFSSKMPDSKVRVVSMDALVKVATSVVAILACPVVVWMLGEILSLRDRTAKIEVIESHYEQRLTELKADIGEINSGIKEIRKELMRK